VCSSPVEYSTMQCIPMPISFLSFISTQPPSNPSQRNVIGTRPSSRADTPPARSRAPTTVTPSGRPVTS
jgi:hypothetical protein